MLRTASAVAASGIPISEFLVQSLLNSLSTYTRHAELQTVCALDHDLLIKVEYLSRSKGLGPNSLPSLYQ